MDVVKDVTLVCCVCLLGCVSAVQAQDSNNSWYLGARAGYSHNQHSCAEAATRCDRDDVGVGVFIGYQFNAAAYALELSATDIGDSSAVYPDVSLDGELTSVDLSFKYSHHFYRQSRIFAKLGAAYWRGEIVGWGVTLRDTGVRPTAGAGLEIPFAHHVSGRLEYQYFDELGNREMGYTHAHFVNLGLQWTF